MKTRIKKMKPVKLVAGMRFEDAMKSLRAGKSIRRRAWSPESRIFRLGGDIFAKLPSSVVRGPSVWRPYPEDFLSTDWEMAKDMAVVTKPSTWRIESKEEIARSVAPTRSREHEYHELMGDPT